MSVKYLTYSEYIHSGVEWLGNIPKSWTKTRLKFEAKINMGQSPNSNDCNQDENGLPFLQGNAEFGSRNPLPKQYCEIPRKIAMKDEMLFSVRAPVGALNIADQNYGIGRGLCAIKSNDRLKNDFLWWLIPVIKSELDSVSTGSTFESVSVEQVENVKVFAPSINEQQRIANFLDHETVKIDTLIEKQQQLIQLLKEKRQAVISHTVTKGLNPDAPMKESGVEWLGEVPEHWGIPKIKWFYQTESGGTPNTSNYEKYYKDGEVPWIRTTDLNNNALHNTPIAITQEALNDSACSLLPINSVLIAMYGGSGSIGKHSILKFESTINQAVCAILPNTKIIPDFLHLYVEFYRPYWMVGAEGTRKDPNINQETIRELVVTCPPPSEQVNIVHATKTKLSVIDEIIKKSEFNIHLMQERRTALISAAVTGKIDVRNWQPAHIKTTTDNKSREMSDV